MFGSRFFGISKPVSKFPLNKVENGRGVNWMTNENNGISNDFVCIMNIVNLSDT
jgi:hypothetical protein